LKLRRLILPVCLLSVIIGLVSCSSLQNQNGATQQLVKVTKGDLAVTVNGSGNLETTQSRILTFGTSGQIQAVYNKEGDKVKKGDRIASLVTNPLALNLTQAEVAYAQAQMSVTQAEVSLKSTQLALNQALGRLTFVEVQAAQADVDSGKVYLEYVTTRMNQASPEEMSSWMTAYSYALARLAAAETKLNAMLTNSDTEEVALARFQVEAAQQSVALANKSLDLAGQTLKEAQRQLDEATLKIPFDGVIARLDAKEGDMVSPAVPVAVIIDPAEMQFEIQVDEIDIVNVKPGQKVKIELDAIPGVALEGRVQFISDLPSTMSGVVVYDTRISLAVPDNLDLKVGMSVGADIVTAEKEKVLLVPDRAIGTNDKGETVVTVRVDGADQTRVVTTGISDGIQTEIVDGLQEGDTVVVEWASKSVSGLF
jgi:HlyD family secretion protein